MKNNYPTSMGKMRYVFCLTLLFSLTLLKAQKKVKTHKDVQVNSAAFVKGPKMNPFKKALNLSNSERGKINKGVAIDKAMIFDFDAKSTGEMMKRNPENLTLNLPFQNSQILELQLTKATIFAESFNVYRGNDRSNPIAVKKGHYYWGMVKGDPNSMVAISVFEDEITGAIRVNGKNLDLGKIKGNKNKRHILYENKDIKTSFDFSCDSLAPEQEGITPNSENPNFQVSEGAPLENCVQIYLEADYELFLQQGSVNAVVDHVTGSFNQVILLYANEQITDRKSVV